MYRIRFAVGLILTLILILAGTASADSKAVMERLKSLEGEWMLVNEQGEVTDHVATEFRMTANGSVLREFMFPGDPHEMLNVYHEDGDRVLMTHYCASGNQPRLEVVQSEEGDGLLLKFESITNLSSPNAHFMHHAKYVWESDGQLVTTWWGSQDGKISDETTVIRAIRRK
ncbi:MAG: hypothetical protein OXC84_03465 [Gammaproteobacteria bacterium]|nr:hypothetical protein [Gammaproteobacteria bacterium]